MENARSCWLAYSAVGISFLFAALTSWLNWSVNGYFTTDEQFIADSGVFMIYGATPRCLDWPAIPMVLVFYLIAIVQCGLAILREAFAGHLTPVDAFRIVDQTAHAYMLDRTPLILAGRIVQVGLISSLLLWNVRIIYRSSERLLPTQMRLPMMVVIALSFDALVATPVIRPEGLAYALFETAMLLSLFGRIEPGRWRGVITVLLLVALLVSHRLLFVFTTPFFVGTLLWRTGFSLRRTLAIISLCGLFLLLAMPFLITDSFVILKAFVGGMMMKVGAAQQDSFLNWGYIVPQLQQPTFWLLIPTVLGAWVFWRTYPYKVVAGLLLGTLAFLTVSVFHASLIYHTHTLPIRCLSTVLIVYGLWWVAEHTRKPWVVAGLLSLYVGTNAYESLQMMRPSFTKSTIWLVADYLETLPHNSRVLIDADFDNLVPRSRDALKRELTEMQNPTLSVTKYNRQLHTSIGTSVPVSMVSILSEDERLGTLQRQVQYQHTPAGRYVDLHFVAPAAGFVNYFVDKQKAMADFEAGYYRYFISSNQLPNHKPVKVFASDYWTTYYLYTSDTVQH